LKNNIIRDTRSGEERKQTVGIRIDKHVGQVSLENNTIEAPRRLLDQRNGK
jgi:hypothetical protein